MHCDCCDVLLTDIEARIKFTGSDSYANTCLNCLSTMGVEYSLPKDAYGMDEEDVYFEQDVDIPLFDDEDLWDER